MRSCSTTSLMPALCVSTSGAAASTVTVSASSPSPSVTLIAGVAPTWRTMPVCAKVRNPASIASSRYGPSGRFGSTYPPPSSVTVVRVKPVSVCVTVTVTPGSTPPLSSATLPLNCAVAWAQAVEAATNTISTNCRYDPARALHETPPEPRLISWCLEEQAPARDRTDCSRYRCIRGSRFRAFQALRCT